jgi:hypothetical protein
MVKYQLGAAAKEIDLVGAESDPRQLTGDVVSFGLVSYSTDADDGIELPSSDRSHAVAIAKHSRLMIGIAAVGSLVDQCSHVMPHPPVEWRPVWFGAISLAADRRQ